MDSTKWIKNLKDCCHYHFYGRKKKKSSFFDKISYGNRVYLHWTVFVWI